MVQFLLVLWMFMQKFYNQVSRKYICMSIFTWFIFLESHFAVALNIRSLIILSCILVTAVAHVRNWEYNFSLILCICLISARTLFSQRCHLVTELDNLSSRLKDDTDDDEDVDESTFAGVDDWKQPTKKECWTLEGHTNQ